VSTQTGSDSAGGDTNVQRAFRLGWRFAELYHSPHCATLDSTATNDSPPQHLPSLSELSDGNRTELILLELTHDVAVLMAKQGQVVGDSTFLNTTLGVMRSKDQDNKARKTAVLGAFREVRIQICATDARFSRAIDLGRMLADTVIQANSLGFTSDYLTEFKSYRLQNAYEWLEDLHTSFPKRASDAVKGSLQCWEKWVVDSDTAEGAKENGYTKRALSLQGERWRRLLSGEILADDLLAAESYRRVASNTLNRIARLTWGFVQRFWPVIALVLGGTGAIIWAIITYAPSGAASVAAVIATVVATLGVSWKTIGSTLGKVVAMAEEPLWNAEVLEAIVVATFIPPVEMNTHEITALRKKIKQSKALSIQSHAELETSSAAVENDKAAHVSSEQPPAGQMSSKETNEARP
jgi:hypothetical protein